MHSAFACGLSGIDVDASSSYCKSCCDDRDAVATGRLRPDGHWRGLSAPVCHQYGSVLGTAPPIALQEDRIPLRHDSHTQETPVGTKAQAVGKKQPPVWSSYRTTFPSKRSETGSLKLQMAGTSKSWKLNPSTFCFAPMRSSGALSLRLPAGLKFRPCACSLSP